MQLLDHQTVLLQYGLAKLRERRHHPRREEADEEGDVPGGLLRSGFDLRAPPFVEVARHQVVEGPGHLPVDEAGAEARPRQPEVPLRGDVFPFRRLLLACLGSHRGRMCGGESASARCEMRNDDGSEAQEDEEFVGAMETRKCEALWEANRRAGLFISSQRGELSLPPLRFSAPH